MPCPLSPNQYLPVLVLLLTVATLGQTKEPIIPQTVEFPSGTLHLKAYLWKPAGPGTFPAVLFNHGSGGDEADITAGMQITDSADILAPFFIKHGYAIFTSFVLELFVYPAIYEIWKWHFEMKRAYAKSPPAALVLPEAAQSH